MSDLHLPPEPTNKVKIDIYQNQVRIGYVWATNIQEAATKFLGKVIGKNAILIP